MFIRNILTQHRHDFTATLQCEGCDHRQVLKTGYDDARYHNFVIPAMECEACGRSRNDILNLPSMGAEW